jgi:hypothetical protein
MHVLGALVALSVWQISIYRGPFKFEPAYAIPSATTTNAPYLREFFYLYHYLGLFPVAVLVPTTAESAKQAERNLRAGGQNVVNEITNEIRRGEQALASWAAVLAPVGIAGVSRRAIASTRQGDPR